MNKTKIVPFTVLLAGLASCGQGAYGFPVTAEGQPIVIHYELGDGTVESAGTLKRWGPDWISIETADGKLRHIPVQKVVWVDGEQFAN
jgi:hypothetical protein